MSNSRFNQYKSNVQHSIEEGEWSWALTSAIIIVIVLLALLVKIIFINVEPFVVLVGGKMPDASNIPFVGWGWDLLNLAFTSLGACLAWVFINICEVLWIFIALDAKAHKGALRQAQQDLQDVNGYPDSSQTRRLRRKGVRIPFFFIEFSPLIGLAGLAVDVLVNWQRYPVITSWSKFWGGLMIQKVMGVNWPNLIALAWNLTSLEILLVLIIICCQWIRAHRSA